ncbi:MAG: hypothetical protein GXO76_06500 [Calditrichaeota bacterium]|nr:hypothetical protein [Calditrichota bacterium]
MVLPKNGGPITYPESNPYYQPLEVQIIPAETIHEETQKGPPPVQRAEAPAKKTSPQTIPSPSKTKQALLPEFPKTDYLILTPEPGSTIEAGDALISVSILADSGIVSPAQTGVWLDGRKLRIKASEYLITAVPSQITPGRHLAKVVFRDPKGRDFRPIQWGFTVKRPKSGALARIQQYVRGTVFTSSRQERVSGRSLVDNRVGGLLTVDKDRFQAGVRFNVTSQEDPKYQPRNRFLFWLNSPWVRLQFGDTSPVFTELMLRGKRVRGVNAQLNLGLFHLSVAAGQTNRPVEGNAYREYVDPLTGDTLYINPDTGDTLTADYIGDQKTLSYGTYAQNLTGIRLAVGKPSSFLWGINLLKVKDDLHSIRYGIRPKDNLVAGTDLLVSLNQGRLLWKTEAALSVLTDDISTGAISKSEIDSVFDTDLPFDPQSYRKWIILNSSTVPLNPQKLTSLAAFSRVQLNYFRNFASIEFKSIGSSYNSLGNSYLRKNIQGLFLSDRIRLFNNALYLNLRYEDYADNFRQLNDNPKVHIRSVRSGLNYYPGPGLPQLNLGFRRYSRNNFVTQIDTTLGPTYDNREKNATNEVTFNVNYRIHVFGLSHRLTYNLIQMSKTDAYADSRLSSYFPIGISNWIHYITVETTYRAPFKSILSFATNRNAYQGGLSRYNFDTVDMRLETLPGRLSFFSYVGLRVYRADGFSKNLSNVLLAKINFQKYQFELGGRLTLWKRHTFSLDANWIAFQDHGERYDLSSGTVTRNPSHQDYLFMARYDYRF